MQIEQDRTDRLERVIRCASCRSSQRIKQYDCTGDPSTCNSYYGDHGEIGKLTR